jgi:hypothetical protein
MPIIRTNFYRRSPLDNRKRYRFAYPRDNFRVMIYAVVFTLFAFFTLMAQVVRKFKFATVMNIGKGGLFLFFVLILLVRGNIDYPH